MNNSRYMKGDSLHCVWLNTPKGSSELMIELRQYQPNDIISGQMIWPQVRHYDLKESQPWQEGSLCQQHCQAAVSEVISLQTPAKFSTPLPCRLCLCVLHQTNYIDWSFPDIPCHVHTQQLSLAMLCTNTSVIAFPTCQLTYMASNGWLHTIWNHQEGKNANMALSCPKPSNGRGSGCSLRPQWQYGKMNVSSK